MEMDLAASPLGAAGKLKGDDNVSISSQSTEEAIMWYEVYSIASDTGLQHLCS